MLRTIQRVGVLTFLCMIIGVANVISGFVEEYWGYHVPGWLYMSFGWLLFAITCFMTGQLLWMEKRAPK